MALLLPRLLLQTFLQFQKLTFCWFLLNNMTEVSQLFILLKLETFMYILVISLFIVYSMHYDELITHITPINAQSPNTHHTRAWSIWIKEGQMFVYKEQLQHRHVQFLATLKTNHIITVLLPTVYYIYVHNFN
jgi:hypothetical protein